jgi:putative ABC transport system permease protein
MLARQESVFPRLEAVREAARALRYDWRTSVLSIALLAVTIGAVMAIFAIVDAVLLRPLPVAHEDRVTVIWQRDDRRALPIIEVAYGEMEDWRARTRSFEQLAVYGSVNWGLDLVDQAAPVHATMVAVSSSFFATVGTPAAAGRWLAASEDAGPRATAMVISHGFWRRHFGADPGVVGRAVPVKFDAEQPPVALTVVGIMPAAFDFPRGAEVFLPAGPTIRGFAGTGPGEPDRTVRFLRVFYALGRLRPGIDVARATQELTQVSRSGGQEGAPEPPLQVVLQPIRDHLIGPAGPVLRTLLGGALLMLLIACANVAGLQVSRASRHQRALAIRAALGASPWRLAAQLVSESALLTAVALTAALGVAWGLLRLLLWLAPGNVPRLADVALLDARVLAVGAAAAFATTTICALWPVAVARRVDVLGVLAHGPSVASDPVGRRVQRAVVVGQIGTAIALLFGTALFLRTVRGLDATVLGFDPEQLLSFQVGTATEDVTRWNAFLERLLVRVEALPNVRAAAVALVRPLNGPIGWDNQPIFPGQPVEDPSTWGLNPHVNFLTVSPRYFETMRTRLVRGRLFTAADGPTAPGVAIVSESAARRLWPGLDPIGQRLREPTYRIGNADAPPGVWQTVVGVVQDVRFRGLNDVRLDLYVPITQSRNRAPALLVRVDGQASGVAAAIRAAVREVDPAGSIDEALTMRDVVDGESAPWRFLMRVFVAFAVVAALLAIIGLAAVVSLAVAARQRELAVRAALGADARRLRRLVLGDAFGLTAAGVVLGLIGAVALGRGVAPVLIGVRSDDPLTLGAVAGLAALAGIGAAWSPARRAARTDPLAALRTD